MEGLEASAVVIVYSRHARQRGHQVHPRWGMQIARLIMEHGTHSRRGWSIKARMRVGKRHH